MILPINIPDNLPAYEVLSSENIFVMSEERAAHQDIRPLKIAILNLMPTKIATETQLLRLIGNTSLQVDITLFHPETHISKNTSEEHLANFYKTFKDIKDESFDGLVITGAPVEKMEFEEVNYWNEITEIMEWSKNNVYSTLHICWGAQAALFYHYGIKKYDLDTKMFGVFLHEICEKNVMLMRGFDDEFYVPHSRHTGIKKEDILNVNKLRILAESSVSGVNVIMTEGGRQIFLTGHSEYDPFTLKTEYDRDINLGLHIDVPENYYPNNDPSKEPIVRWRGHANLLFANWLNYYVYQGTPFDLKELKI